MHNITNRKMTRPSLSNKELLGLIEKIISSEKLNHATKTKIMDKIIPPE